MLKFLEKYNWIPITITIILAAAIFYFSSLEHDPAPGIGYPLKTVVYHLGIFFLLCFFLMISLSRGKNKDWMFFAIIFSAFYAITDELHQHFVQGRHVSVGDFLIDLVGIIFAFLVYSISLAWRDRKK